MSIEKMYKKTVYTLKEKRDYHNKLARVGALHPTTGEVLNDKQRAYHAGAAKQLHERYKANLNRYYHDNPDKKPDNNK